MSLYWDSRRLLLDKPEPELDEFLAAAKAGQFQAEYGYGYEIVSISLAGGPGLKNRRYTVVLMLRDEAFPTQLWVRGDAQTILATVAEVGDQETACPALVTAVGNGKSDAFFFVVMVSECELPRALADETVSERLAPVLQIGLGGTRAKFKRGWIATPPPDKNDLTDEQRSAREQTLAGCADIARRYKRRPRSVSPYETADGYLFAVTWVPDPADHVHWALQIFPEVRGFCALLDPCIAGMTKGGLRPLSWVWFPEHTLVFRRAARPHHDFLEQDDLGSVPYHGPYSKPRPPVHPGPPSGFVEGKLKQPMGGVILWEDSFVDSDLAYTFGGGDRAWLDRTSRMQKRFGRRPIWIQMTGANEASRCFTAAFAATDRVTPRALKVRTLKASGPVGKGQGGGHGPDPFQTIDDFVQGYLRASGARAGQLAIARDGRLVFARTYKWAESWYPLPEHTTVFRWGSVSKTITAIGLMRLVDEGLVDTSQKVLDAFTDLGGSLMGAMPTDELKGLTLADALRHTGGLDRPLNSAPPQVGYPETDDEHLARLLASTNPIDELKKGDRVYEGANFYLVGRVVGAPFVGQPQAGWTEYRERMQGLFRDALNIDRAHLSRGDAVYAGEAIPHHLTPFVAPSQRFKDVFDEAAYTGDHTINGAAGGWAMAAVDMARFFAALDWPTPLLSAAALRKMTNTGPAPGATTPPGEDNNWGFGMNLTTVAPMHLSYHNGAMPGFASFFMRVYRDKVWLPSIDPGNEEEKNDGGDPGGGGGTPLPINPLAEESPWAITLVINSELPSGMVGGSFTGSDGRKLWKLIREIPESAWPKGDLFGEIEDEWKVQRNGEE